MVHYIIQTIAFHLFFLIVYDAFLKKETFFNWNRAYLLITVLLSVVLPFVKIDSISNVVPNNFIVTLPEVLIGQIGIQETSVLSLEPVFFNTQTFWSLSLLFYLGVTIASILFFYKISKLLVLIYKNPKQKLGNLLIVILRNSNDAFSFFNRVFIGDNIKKKDKTIILKHEAIHVKQKHTLDLLFFEVLRIIFWFNPFVYMYQNRIASLHEYIADSKAIKNQDKTNYYQNLLSQVFETKNVSFINSFYKQSLIKKRIIMLQKSKSKQYQLLKYALLIPLVFTMLIYTSCEKSESNLNNSELTLTKQIEQLKSTILNEEEISVEELKSIEDLLKTSLAKRTNNTETISEINYDGKLEVPFAVIDEVPLYSGCESLSTNAERKTCMSKKITKHVQENFNAKIADETDLVGMQRISVIFKIDKTGNVMGVRARAPHKLLEDEAIRVIKMLPKMTPGKQKGETVIVPYSLPIVFKIDE